MKIHKGRARNRPCLWTPRTESFFSLDGKIDSSPCLRVGGGPSTTRTRRNRATLCHTQEQCHPPPRAGTARLRHAQERGRAEQTRHATMTGLWNKQSHAAAGPGLAPHGLAYLPWCSRGCPPPDSHDSWNSSTRAHLWSPEVSSSSHADHRWSETRESPR